MTALPSASVLDTPLTEGDFRTNLVAPILAVLAETPGGAASSELTISSGSVTPTGWAHSIDTQGDASTDDLTNIALTNHPNGREILIFAANGGRAVVVKHSAGGSGQIVLLGAADYTLDATTKVLRLRRDGTQWVEQFLNPGTPAAWRTYLGAAAASHSHAISDVTGLQTALDAKAASSHTHTISQVTGLQTALDGKAPLIGAVPVGTVVPYVPNTAPSGWLLCYGQSLLRTSYAALFAAIGTTFGAADSTHFNAPDLRGRVAAGKDNMGGSSADRLTSQSGGLNGDTLGATGGAETHTLSIGEIPAHTHGLANTNTQNQGLFQRASGAGTDFQTGSAGGGGAHNNVQPTIILNYIIFAGV